MNINNINYNLKKQLVKPSTKTATKNEQKGDKISGATNKVVDRSLNPERKLDSRNNKESTTGMGRIW